MAGKTLIEYATDVWNVLYGCDPVSPGCKNCYAKYDTRRLEGAFPDDYHGLTVMTDRGVRWTGDITLRPDKLDVPLRWQKPRVIFVNSLSDVFHKDVPSDYIAAMFAVMGAAAHHQFQMLTKRPENMLAWFQELAARYDNPWDILMHCERCAKTYGLDVNAGGNWPLRNVWLGASVESQKYADKRIPILQKVPATIRYLSLEPLLGPLDDLDLDRIHWVIVGGESRVGARPMDPEWVRGVRDRCIEEDVPFFLKQWGNHDEDGVWHKSKKETGCLLDGVEFKEVPASVTA